MAKATEEGVQRGMHILASMAPKGRRYLWTVSRVLGKHKVQAISHTGDMLMEAEMWTHNINNPDSDTSLVNYIDSNYPEFGALEVYDLVAK